MAIAFYIPDQANLLRKAQQQEQQILALREAHWRYVASLVYDALRQYFDAAPSLLHCSKNCKKFPASNKQF